MVTPFDIDRTRESFGSHSKDNRNKEMYYTRGHKGSTGRMVFLGRAGLPKQEPGKERPFFTVSCH